MPINLSTTEDVRREMGGVYRETRSRKIATNKATKLVYMLTQVLKATELYLLERRLVELEEKLRPQKPKIYWLVWLECEWRKAEGIIRNKNDSIEDFKKRVLLTTDKQFIWVK